LKFLNTNKKAMDKIKVYKVDDGDSTCIYETLSAAKEHLIQGLLAEDEETFEGDGDGITLSIEVDFMTREEIDALPEI
jgi:hypothetical protein